MAVYVAEIAAEMCGDVRSLSSKCLGALENFKIAEKSAEMCGDAEKVR